MRCLPRAASRGWLGAGEAPQKGDEPDPGTGHNGWGCFVPDLTRLAALPCGEARHCGL